MLAIGMITCPRPGIDVHESINQLRRGGFRETVHLFCEPGTPELRPLPNVIIHRNPVRLGVVGNWSHCLQWLVEHTSADFLMVCEDDVIYATGARTALDSDLEAAKDVGYWSLYTAQRDAFLTEGRRGWIAWNRGHDNWGTLSMCFPRSSAERVIVYPALKTEDQLEGHTDFVVAQCFLDAGIACWYHNPSLADHVGRISTIGHGWYEESLGLHFDSDFEPGTQLQPANDSQQSTAMKENRSSTIPRTAVISVYQNNIPLEVISLQSEVICRFLPAGCEYEPREAKSHAAGLDTYFQELRHEAYLVLDIDCIPLADWVIPWILQNALAGILVGGAQRANQFENGEHIYVGPGVMAFSKETFQRMGCLSFKDTNRGDVGEEFTYAAERLGIPISLLWPTHVNRDKWPLRGGRWFGHGTIYGGAFFHTYEISRGETVSMFIEQCNKVLGRKFEVPAIPLNESNSSNVGKWNHFHRADPMAPYGTSQTFDMGAEWLMNCDVIEDRGCGTGWFARTMKSRNPAIQVIELDGSPLNGGIAVDLEDFQPEIAPDGIFMRHVLEHNWNWKRILANALNSFGKRMALVLFTPLEECDRNIYNHSIGVPVLCLSGPELHKMLDQPKLKYSTVALSSDTEFGAELLYRIERI
jgi:hypothetical protein